MTDRVHPSAKTTTNGGANPTFPATKSQLYGANRPTYRPQPYNRRNSRGWCCSICFWLILIILILLLLIGIAGTAVYLLYRPQRPSFSITSLKLTRLSTTSKFELTLSATNPNKKITFFYQPTSVSILSGDDDFGEGTLPAFEHAEQNTTVMKASIVSDAATQLKEKMESDNGLDLKVKLETKVDAKMGPLKTPPVGIRVLCDGISVAVPAGKKSATARATNAVCDVDVRFKVWKWTVG